MNSRNVRREHGQVMDQHRETARPVAADSAATGDAASLSHPPAFLRLARLLARQAAQSTLENSEIKNDEDD